MNLHPAQEPPDPGDFPIGPIDPSDFFLTDTSSWEWLEEIWYFFVMLSMASAMMALVIGAAVLRAYGRKQEEERRREELRQEIRTEVKAQLCKEGM